MVITLFQINKENILHKMIILSAYFHLYLKEVWSLMSENEVRSVDSRPYRDDSGSILWGQDQLSASVEEKVYLWSS